MKIKLKSVLVALTVVFLMGCELSKTEKAPALGRFKQVALGHNIGVYLVDVEGVDYVIVVGATGVAICQKVTKPE